MPLHIKQALKMKSKISLKVIEEKIIKALCAIYDPEIPVSIYELGLIYNIEISKTHDVVIDMTLTSPNCPVAETLPVEVEEKIQKVYGVNNVKVSIVFDPPWEKDMMSDEAKIELGMI